MLKRLTWVLLGSAVSVACSGSDGANGTNGSSPQLLLTDEPAGANCTYGGTQIAAGVDKDGNGALDAAEVTQTSYVCKNASSNDGKNGTNGSNGSNGSDGADGTDGHDVLIGTSEEPAGTNCEFGGKRITTGLDANGDGKLSESEVSQTTFVCGAKPGAGNVGFRLVSKFTGVGGPIAEIISASPDGKTLVYTSSTAQTIGFVDITNPATPVLIGNVDVKSVVSNDSGEPTSVAFSPDGKHVVVVVKDTTNPIANADPGALVVIDVASRTIVGKVAVGVGPDSIHLTPDGARAVIAIEDEEDADNNGVAQKRPGSVQIVKIDYQTPANSVVTTVALSPTVGNFPTDPQPEFVDITKDGKTAVVSLQENNAFVVIDIEKATVVRYIDAGTSTHARADLLNDKTWNFSQPFTGQLQPDGTCLLPDQQHFLSANEGDTPHAAAAPNYAGGRGYSIFSLDGTRAYDSGDSAEWVALRSGAYPDARSPNKGVEPEGCAAGTFFGAPYAFLTGERNSSLYVLDVADPRNPHISQIMGAPMRPESATVIESRNLLAVGGEGDGTGGGIWLYEAVNDAADGGHGAHIYDPRSADIGFGALSGLAYEPSTGMLLGVPDNAYLESRIWSFAVDHESRKMNLVRELKLTDAKGAPLTGYDPEGISINPEGGYVLVSEGVAGNGSTTACVGTATSNRILFFDTNGRLNPAYGNGGIVDFPCGTDTNAFDWAKVTANGYEGLAVVDSTPAASGGLKIYTAFQRPLTGETNTRIGEYDVDTRKWNFYFYQLDTDPGGAAGKTFLSELLYVGGDRFAVIERDQGWAGAATNKTIRTFSLSSGTKNDATKPVAKSLAYDLLKDSFRFDQEKIEGLALGGGSFWVVNDNDGGTAQEFFMRLDPSVLAAPANAPEVVPNVVINEVNSTLQPNDWVELLNKDATPADISGWTLTDSEGGVKTLPAGTTIPANGIYLVNLVSNVDFGLGKADSVTVATSRGTKVDSYAWTDHVKSASRCGTTGLVFWPTTGDNGSGAPSPGAVNNCTGPTIAGQADIVINEVVSNPIAGAPKDYIELYNKGTTTVNLSFWKLTDADFTQPDHVYVVPEGTTIAPGAALVFENETTFPFGLGGADSARLLSPYDVLVDQYSWTTHQVAGGRCPNGTGNFVNNLTATPNAVNACP